MFRKRKNKGFIQHHKNGAGFTLIQLIITVAIISILAGAVLFGEDAISRKGKAQDVKRQIDIENIAKAVELYQIDNGALPSDLAAANVDTGQKKVLCSSLASLTCDGQTRQCVVVDDEDFIKPYFGDSLPIDPQKTDQTDTGYYITRSGDKMVFGACDTYEIASIDYIAMATLPTYSITCGDGEIEGAEVCDDGNETTEYCGDGNTDVGACNATCSATITDEVCDDGNAYNEACGDGALQTYGTSHCDTSCSVVYTSYETCDYYSWSNDCELLKGGWATVAAVPSGVNWCLDNCRISTGDCLSPPEVDDPPFPQM